MVLVATAFIVDQIDESGFKVWLQRRKEDGPLDGLLEMPGGKIEATESPGEAMLREVREESGAELEQASLLFKIYPHQYKDRKVALYTYLVQGEKFESEQGAWFQIGWDQNLKDWNLLEANFKIFNEIREYLKKHFKAGLISQIWKS